MSAFDSHAYAWHEEGLREAPPSQNDLSPWIYPQRLTEEYITQLLEIDGIDLAEINPASKEQYSAAWVRIQSGPGLIIKELAEATVIDPKNLERSTYIATPDVLRLLEARKKAFALATQADDILFQEIMSGQSTAIQQILISLQNQRKADIHQLRTLLPGSQINLDEIINELNIDDLVGKTIQLIIEEYKTEYAPLIIKRWERLNKLDTSEVNLHIQLGPKWQQILNGGLKSEAFEQLRRIDSARIRTEFPLRELNSNYIQRIVKILPSPLSMDFRSRCNTSIYPKIYAEINGLKKVSEELSSLSGVQAKDREAIKERVLVFQEKNSKLVFDIEQLIENRYRLDHRNPEDFSDVDNLEDASENIQNDNRSDSLELLDADYAYLQAIMELRNRQIAIASALRGALPTNEAYVDTAQRGLEMIQDFIDRSKAKNRRDAWRIDQHFESARVLMSPETYRNQESTSPSDQP